MKINVDDMEFMIDKMKRTKTNEEFFATMSKKYMGDSSNSENGNNNHNNNGHN